MKTPLILSLLLAVPAFAGTPVTQESPPPAPVHDTWNWFVGATGGYLFEAEEDIYTFQFGAKSPWSIAGWSVALFAEVGWTENHDGFDLDEPPFNEHIGADLDIVPVTFNVKFEHMFSSSWSTYIGGGIGAANVSGDLNNPIGVDVDSPDDWVFSAQIFMGVAYHVNECFEIFGGGRWVYFDEPGSGENYSLGNDWMLEGGVRFHF